MDRQWCLRNAAGCERMARLCDDPNERALWVRIALDWLKLAEMERRADFHQVNGGLDRANLN
jgi:hypothetical protein